MSTNALPPHSTETDRVRDIKRVIQLTLTFYEKLDGLPSLLGKINRTSLALTDQQVLENLLSKATAIQSSYSRSFIDIRESATDLEYIVQRFTECLGMIHDPDAKNSDLVAAFEQFIKETHFDPKTPERDMGEFAVVAQIVVDLADQFADSKASATKGLIAKRTALSDLEAEKSGLLQKKSKIFRYNLCSIISYFAPTDEKMKKLEGEIAASKVEIQQLDAEIECLVQALKIVGTVVDELKSDAKEVGSSLHIGPQKIATTFRNVYQQLTLDATTFRNVYQQLTPDAKGPPATQNDSPITNDTVSNAKNQHQDIMYVLHALATT